MLTMNDLINRVERRLSMVVGSQVQRYAEDPIRDMICETYRRLSRKHWWAHQSRRFDRVVDGVDGVVTEDIEGIAEFGDVQFVFTDDHPKPLVHTNVAYNQQYYIQAGGWPQYIEAHPDIRKLIQFYPKNATGGVHIIAREVITHTIAIEEVVPFDEDVLTLHVAWDYATDDGTNMGAIEKLRTAANEAYQDYRARNSFSFPADTLYPLWPTQWMVAS